MERRKFTREFKLEAVKLIQERGVTVTQAARDFRRAWHGVAAMGAGVCERFAAGLSGPRADEAGAGGTRSPAP